MYYFTGQYGYASQSKEFKELSEKPWHEWLKSFLQEELGIASDRELPDNLAELFEQRLKEQKKAHQGGNKWIGTGGTSFFGHSGRAKGGFRVGGASLHQSAQKVYGERKYYSIRDDQSLNEIPFHKLMQAFKQKHLLKRKTELDLAKTFQGINRTAEVIPEFKSPKFHKWNLCLLLDNGGSSMLPFAELCAQMVIDLKKELPGTKDYYFHNTIYDEIYTEETLEKSISLEKFLNKHKNSILIFVGDAAMAPSELFSAYGALHWENESAEPSFNQLKKIKKSCPNSVWLNPLLNYQSHLPYTVSQIQQLFSMFPMTLEGLRSSFLYLQKKGVLA